MPTPLAARSTFWRVALGIYTFSLVCGTHWPSTPWPTRLTLVDKLLHFAAYLVLAILVAMNWAPALTIQRIAFYRRALFGLLIFAAVDELTQGPVPGRYPDILDWLADGLGIVVGLILFERLWARWADRFRFTPDDPRQP
ncbi:MAG: VanZ family protein [Planctomycetota bacterium]